MTRIAVLCLLPADVLTYPACRHLQVAYFDDNAASNKNIEGLTFGDDEAGYLAGVVAGGVAALGGKKLGVIGGLPITPVIKFIDGFTNGALYSCPDCVTTAIYCPFGGAPEEDTGDGHVCPGEFADVAFGVNLAKYFLDQEVDVIFGAGGLTGSAGIKYASAPSGTMFSVTGATSYSGTKTERGTPYVVGVDKDEYYTTFDSGAWPGAARSLAVYA